MAVTKVVMPKLSEAMETGKVIKWLRNEGDRVQSGDIVAEIETDKADVEMEAFGAGVLRKIVVPAGERAPVGSLIGVIAEPGEDIASVLAEAGGPSPAAKAPPAVSPAPAAPVPKSVAPAAAPAPAVSSAAAAVPAAPVAERLRVSPLARKVAAQAGLDLRLIQGTGPGGRIIRRDVEAATTAGAVAAPAAAAAAPAAAPALRPVRPDAAGPEYEVVALTPMRAAIAKQMPLSKAPIPHFYVTSEVAMDRAWDLRQELNALDGQPKISVNDLVVRACALALTEHPYVNASFQGDAVRVYHRAHIGIAVALDDGLITPVLRNCESKPLAQIAVESRDLAERARARKLRAQELSGATFSISNLGMYDVAEFSAIINPPEGAILAVGSVRQVPVVAGPGLGVGRRMNVTLSCDHRVMDGAMGARFLQTVRRLLEEPLRLLIS
ncbi:MAG: dihydrolipoamide acyltransferase [Candidatus Rokuibacteriota bacterium]|nr:MAG: dihydrolipoamide acyltransferase [Candidatus Rokubacteria bacterium]